MAEDAALYWSKKNGNLAELINKSGEMDSSTRDNYGNMARARINTVYSWNYIGEKYKGVWIK